MSAIYQEFDVIEALLTHVVSSLKDRPLTLDTIQGAAGKLLALKERVCAVEENDAADLEVWRDRAITMEFLLTQAKTENAVHERDYLAIWRLVKAPNETVVDAVKRVIKERDEAVKALNAAGRNNNAGGAQ